MYWFHKIISCDKLISFFSNFIIFSIFPDVILSAIGALLFLAVFITWIVIFQTHRAEWGEFADSISYIIPTGIP